MGSDIEIPNYPVKIHQPTINEIAIIGEERFFSCFGIFQLNVEEVKEDIINSFREEFIEERALISKFDELETIYFLLRCDEFFKDSFELMFNLIIKDYTMNINEELGVYFIKEDNMILLDRELFENIKEIMIEVLIFKKFFATKQYAPTNKKAEEIAQKLKRAKEKINELNKTSEDKNVSLFANIVSILGTQGYSLSELNNLTIYQLYNQFERFTLYMQYDQGMKAALAGAKVELVDWFKEL